MYDFHFFLFRFFFFFLFFKSDFDSLFQYGLIIIRDVTFIYILYIYKYMNEYIFLSVLLITMSPGGHDGAMNTISAEHYQ